MRPARADALVALALASVVAGGCAERCAPLTSVGVVAVFQPDVRGVRLSSIADFTFLQDVYRQATGR